MGIGSLTPVFPRAIKRGMMKQLLAVRVRLVNTLENSNA